MTSLLKSRIVIFLHHWETDLKGFFGGLFWPFRRFYLRPITTLTIIALVVCFGYIMVEYSNTKNFVLGHSFWDWLEVLLFPLAIVLIVWLLGRADRQVEKKRQETQERIEKLNSFFSNITNLISSINLNDERLGLDEENGILISSLVRITLPGLEGQQKAAILRFLYEQGLIGYIRESDQNGSSQNNIIPPKVDLNGADLSNLEYPNLKLEGVCLVSVDLSGANLEGTNLESAILRSAMLNNTNLRMANLKNAVLDISSLNGADCSGADMSYANLSSATIDGIKARFTNLTGATLAGLENRLELIDAIGIQDTQEKKLSPETSIFSDIDMEGNIARTSAG